MRSSSIYYRVADFLKSFPPFSFVSEEDLLRLAGSGRVKFHESDEYVYWQGSKPGRFIFVIQQGTLKLVDESQQAEALQDVLGEGDIIGAEGLAGKSEYQYSAKTTSDVIIYALPATEFEELGEKHPKFARYIESNFSVAPAETTGKSADGASGVLRRARLPIDFLASRMLTCDSDTPLEEAVELMKRQGRDTLVVTNGGVPAGYFPAGYLNDTSFRPLATGDVGGGRGQAPSLVNAMVAPLPLLSDALAPHVYAMEMLRRGCSAAGMTGPEGDLKALVTESDLTLLGVPNLPQLGRKIRRSRTLPELGELRRLALRFASRSLTDPSAVEWVSEAFSELNRLIVGRAIELTEGAADDQPEANLCWVFFGAAARGELLTGAMPDLGIVYENGDGEAARKLGEDVAGALRQCGYHSPGDAITPAGEEACRSLAEWKDSYSRWISDPVLSGLYAGLRFFELAPVRGDPAPVAALQQHIQEQVKKNEYFVPLLANDSMGNLPPLTFFQGLVVQDDGERSDRFDLRRGALRPLADVGRVFALERADSFQTATVARFEAAGAGNVAENVAEIGAENVAESNDAGSNDAANNDAESNEQRTLFADAASTFRVALYHQARTGLRDGAGGWEIEPKALSKLEQQVLKNGFRTIMKLLQFTAERNGIRPR